MQSWVDGETTKIIVNPTQVLGQMNHPVFTMPVDTRGFGVQLVDYLGYHSVSLAHNYGWTWHLPAGHF